MKFKWTNYYKELTSRNMGILKESEQEKLRKSTVAVAGCGCIGALSSELLVRAGLGKIIVADPDVFEISNVNRQVTALSTTIGKNKAECLAQRLKEINPEVEVQFWNYEVDESNAKKFIEGADIVIDGMDYYAADDMIALHRAAELMSIPVVTAVSLTFGGNYFAFDEDSMTFEKYVGFKGQKDFLVPPKKYAPKYPKGIPASLVLKILKKEVPIPTTGIGQAIACGILSKEAINYLARGKKLKTVPEYISFNIDLS